MALTDWFKRRILAGPVEGDWDWPIKDLSDDGRRARCKFDGVRVEISKERATVYLTWKGKAVIEYAHRAWVDFGGGEVLNVDFHDLDGSMWIGLGDE